jgi:hypothetical protein
MKSPELEPTPVKVIGAAVLSCLDDMYYRLPFTSQDQLEKLIKDVQGDTEMNEFRAAIREDLNDARALKEFESGWEKYWAETRSQQQAAASRAQSGSVKDRLRSESPTTPTTPSGNGDGDGADKSAASSEQVQRRLSLLLPVLHSLVSLAFPAENPFHTAGLGIGQW